MTASASMPPTPQPTTPRPLIIVVWLSVPTSVSGKATGPAASSREEHAPWPGTPGSPGGRCPRAGGTTRKLSNAFWPQRRNSYRSRLRWNSISTFWSSASGEPKRSTCTEWSITRSTGTSGLIRFGIAAEPLHRAAHGGQIDHRRHAGEILQHDPGRLEGNLDLGRRRRRSSRPGSRTSSSVTS